jgi:hypothetical protein
VVLQDGPRDTENGKRNEPSRLGEGSEPRLGALVRLSADSTSGT